MHVLQTDAKEFYRSNRRCTLRVVPCFALRIVENFVIELAGSLDTGKAHELFVSKSANLCRKNSTVYITRRKAY